MGLANYLQVRTRRMKRRNDLPWSDEDHAKRDWRAREDDYYLTCGSAPDTPVAPPPQSLNHWEKFPRGTRVTVHAGSRWKYGAGKVRCIHRPTPAVVGYAFHTSVSISFEEEGTLHHGLLQDISPPVERKDVGLLDE